MDIYGMKTDTLEENIHKWGAMNALLSNHAQVEIGNEVQDILHAYKIIDWQSEPHYQHQNPAEQWYQTVLWYTNNIMNHTGTPDYTWLLCLVYVCILLNHLATESLNWQVPLQHLTGSTPDISALLLFEFLEPIYYAVEETSCPSHPVEALGHWVGIAEHVGDTLTFKVLTDDTHKIIYSFCS
jgi:hypothetical protein